MKRLLLLLLLIPLTTYAQQLNHTKPGTEAEMALQQGQQGGYPAYRFRRLTSEPATCTAGDVYYNTVTHLNRQCLTTDTWSDVGATGVAASTSITDDATAAKMFPVWVTAATGNLPLKVSSGKFVIDASTGALGLGIGTKPEDMLVIKAVSPFASLITTSTAGASNLSFSEGTEVTGTSLGGLSGHGSTNSEPDTIILSTSATGKLRFSAAAGIIGVSGAALSAGIGAVPSHAQAFTWYEREELLTIGAGATSVTTMLIPANAVVLSVSTRVTTVIPVAATFTVTVGGTTCSTTAISTAATTTDPGTFSGAFYNSTAQGITITPNTAPLANTGRVRVTVVYYVITPPTS